MPGLSRGVYIFYEYGDGSHILAYSFFDGNNWTVNQVVTNTLTSGPPALVLRNNNLYCFHQGASARHDSDKITPNGQFWYNVFDGVNWRGDQQVGNTCLSYHPSALIYNNQVYVFHQGADGDGNPTSDLWYNIYQGSGQWSGDTQVSNTTLNDSPSAIVWYSQILCFHQTAGNNNLLFLRRSPQDGSILDEPASGDTLTNSPAVLTYNGVLQCFYQRSDGTNDLRYAVASLTNPPVLWNPQTVPGATVYFSPAPCVFNNRLYCFHHSADWSNTLYCQVWVGENWAGEFQVPGVSIANSPGVVAVD
jgi:hypothetical protein